MLTFLLFAPASTKWLGCGKDRTSPMDRIGRFCDIYCEVILQHSFALCVISDILWSSCFSESYALWTKILTTLVKRRRSYKVRITLYTINTWRVCQTRVHKSFTGNLARHSFSLFDRNKTQAQTSKTSEQRLTSH